MSHFFSVFNKAQSFDHMCLYFFSSVNCLSIFECFANKAFVSYLFNQQLSPNSNHTKKKPVKLYSISGKKISPSFINPTIEFDSMYKYIV